MASHSSQSSANATIHNRAFPNPVYSLIKTLCSATYMSFILRDIANWYLMAKNPVQRSGVRSCQWLYMACFGIWHCSFRFNTLRPEGLVCWSYCCYCCLSTWDKPSKFEPARDALRIQIRNKRSKSSTAIRRVTSTHIVPPIVALAVEKNNAAFTFGQTGRWFTL